jgi:hypothetical protein
MQQGTPMNSTDALRKLIRACVDDERTLRHESTVVGATRADTLTRLASQRRKFVTDLEEIQEHEEPHDGSWRELSREAARDVWVAAAGRNEGDAIAACRHSSTRTAAVYEEAMQMPWRGETLRLLSAQQRALKDDAELLDHLEA